jgi:hypothetical protein
MVVESLVEPFVGTHRTIYVDRFYTSLDLLKSLAERNLYITGTVLQNRIPKEIRIAKTSAEYKGMTRGDSLKCKVSFTKEDGKTKAEAGLVCWRDRQIVYCLSNDTNNHEVDECTRRGNGGIIRIERPISIANYNRYMGGVDLADMRRLHCNSTIMGQNRWWLKLFFYLLDVGTSNALVLYNEAMKSRHGAEQFTAMNIVKFKMQLVEGLVGKKVDELFEGPNRDFADQHIPIHIKDGARKRCAYCAMKVGKVVRTRYKCAACGVPLCCIGHGRNETDCFSLAHKTETNLQLVSERYLAMQRMDRTKK